MTPTLVALLLAAGISSFGIAALCTAMIVPIARRIGFVDRPGNAGSHKSHRDPIPYGGGIAIFAGCWLPMIAVGVAAWLAPADWTASTFGPLARDLLGGVRDHAPQAGVILIGAALLLALGIIDDARPLGPLVKLPAIVGVSLLVALWGDVRIAEFAPEPVSVALTVLWISIIINAMNFLDNMDGLSAGVAAVCTAFLLVCGVMAGQQIIPTVAAAFLGAVLGFLLWNFPPARIFMGDAGSLPLGYMLAVISVLTSYWQSGGSKPAFPLAMPLVVLAIPLYDFTSVVVIRMLEGRNPLKGDQRHFSHRLVERGLSRRFAVLTIYLAAATTGLAATLLPAADLSETIRILCICLLVLMMIAILESAPGSDA